MFNFIIKKVITAIVLFSSLNTRAELVLSYIDDCLGGYRYEIPTSSNVSLMPGELLNSGFSGSSAGSFVDGDRVSNYGYSNELLVFNSSELKLKNELNDLFLYVVNLSDKKDYINDYIIARKEKKKKGLISVYKDEWEKSKIEHIGDTVFFAMPGEYKFVSFIGNVGFSFSGLYGLQNNVSSEDALRRAKLARASLTPRRPNEIPSSGLCIPMATLKKQADIPGYALVANYKVMDHPEVTFSIKETFRGKEDKDDIEAELRQYWDAVGGSLTSDPRSGHWIGFPKVRSRSLGRIPGKRVFGQYTSKVNGKTDYMYIALATARNDRESTLKLVGMLTTSKAKGEPMSKEDFKALMDHIAESISPRKVAEEN